MAAIACIYKTYHVFIDDLIKDTGETDKGKLWAHHLVALGRFLNSFQAVFYHLKMGGASLEQCFRETWDHISGTG